MLILAGSAMVLYLPERERNLELIAGYGIASLGFLWALAFNWDRNQLRVALAIAMISRVLALWAPAVLSDDWYRFIYDGRLILEGINPFLAVPSANPQFSPDLYDSLNSGEYYTVYPPFLQFFFAIAVWLGHGTVAGSLLFLRLTILLFELGSISLLYRLMPDHRKSLVLLYALCPLAIIEMTGGVHFEAAMTFFLLLSAWHLHSGRHQGASISLGLAAAAKLIPVVFFPLLVPLLGWKRGFMAILIAGLTMALTFAPFWTPDLLPNMQSSMNLYFQSFEFNGSIYYLVRMWTIFIQGWNEIALTGPATALAGVLLMIAVAIWRFPDRAISFLITAGLMLAIYQLFATTVHPWYIAPLVALLSMSTFRFAVVWALLIPLTYLSYRTDGVTESSLVIILEYAVLGSVLVWELIRNSGFGMSLKQYFAKQKAAIKLKRLGNWLDPSEKVLEVGSGNGALALGWREQLIQVETLDVVNQSLFKEVQPRIYDGGLFPYEGGTFDTVTLITMLHHCPDPESVLREAARVADKRLIVMEDVYASGILKRLTFWMDSLVNREWAGHPHTNRTEQEWEELFNALGLQILQRRRDKVLRLFTQTTWDLQKPSSQGA